jgi:hypothetical protein
MARRTCLPDPEDYDEKLEAMSVCKARKLGLSAIHEAACVVYIRHQYNPVVVDYLLGDEFFYADRAATSKDRIRTSVNEV